MARLSCFKVPNPSPVKIKYHLVVDSGSRNPYFVMYTTNNESLSKVPAVLVRDNWMVAVDNSDAYHHLATKESDRDLVAVCDHGEYLLFLMLPFG